MGCGASKSADPGVAPRRSAPRKRGQDHLKKSKLDGADDIGANFDAAAAVTVATGTAALCRRRVSDARGAMSRQRQQRDGSLAFAKVPWVAPIAVPSRVSSKLRRKCTRSRLTRRCSARTCRIS